MDNLILVLYFWIWISPGEVRHHSTCASTWSRMSTFSRHDCSNPTQPLLIQLILLIHATSDGINPIVEEIIMQLAITGAELLLLEEQAIIHERQGVEDVELVALGEDERIVDELVEALLQGGLVEGLLQADFGGVVEEVGDADDVVLGVADDGGFDAEEGEEVGDFLVSVL